ncbi:MCP four helix bundle domain-containing protein [Pedobacter alpinus]|uniref:MCP four helix bundle domain-containing protein n=1 Tax=Pedobacter alpinus TaxID=1590643 RepID=A0ABW5TVX5_9SPHI
MKWSLMFKEKMKAAIVLVALMVAIIISNLLEKKISESNDYTVASIFEDRLQPSVDLYEMRTLNEQRLFILEEYLHANEANDQTRLEKKLNAVHKDFDKLLLKYEGTILVDREKNALLNLKTQLAYFDNAFSEIKKSDKNAEEITIAKFGLNKANESLGNLSKLQSEVGRELLIDYKKDTFYSSFLNSFQILLSIIIGVILLKMVANSTLLNKFDKKVNLN